MLKPPMLFLESQITNAIKRPQPMKNISIMINTTPSKPPNTIKPSPGSSNSGGMQAAAQSVQEHPS
jgi:hypothetical protein